MHTRASRTNGGSAGSPRARHGGSRRAVTRSGERGAAAVEFALVLPLLLALIFGMIDFGLAIADTQALRSGANTAARRAAVGDYGTDTSCSLIGTTAATETHELMCLAKSEIGLSADDSRVKVVVPDPYEVGAILAVCVQYPLSSATGLFTALLQDHTVKSKIDVRVENESDTAPESAAESPIDGNDWAWCT